MNVFSFFGFHISFPSHLSSVSTLSSSFLQSVRLNTSFFIPSSSRLLLLCPLITHLPHLLFFFLPTSQLFVCVCECVTVCYTFTVRSVFFDSLLAGLHPSSSLTWLNTQTLRKKKKNNNFLFLCSGSLSIVFVFASSFPSSPPPADGGEERKKGKGKERRPA